MPGVKGEKGAGLKISKGETQEQDPVMETERRARKKVLNVSLRVVQTGGINFTGSRERCCMSVPVGSLWLSEQHPQQPGRLTRM